MAKVKKEVVVGKPLEAMPFYSVADPRWAEKLIRSNDPLSRVRLQGSLHVAKLNALRSVVECDPVQVMDELIEGRGELFYDHFSLVSTSAVLHPHLACKRINEALSSRHVVFVCVNHLLIGRIWMQIVRRTDENDSFEIVDSLIGDEARLSRYETMFKRVEHIEIYERKEVGS